MKIVVEHLEEGLWRWIYLEYENLSQYIGRENLIFTNIKRREWFDKLKKLGEVWTKSIIEYPDKNRLIILDPKAEKTLRSSEINEDDYIIIGGILGEYPPRGRTYKLLTSKLAIHGVRTYNLGKKIFPIDSAGAIAYKIYKGTSLNNIETIDGLEIEIDNETKMYLPFSYPIIEGKIFINPKLIEYIKRESPLNPYSNIWACEV